MSEQQQYRMPAAEVGLPVLWYPGGDRNQQPAAAVVTAIGFDTLNLNLMMPQTYTMLIRDGVRHIDDKRAKTPELAENGAWDYAPWYKRLLKLPGFFAGNKKEELVPPKDK